MSPPRIQPVRVTATAQGGATPYHRVSTGDNNAASIKASSGTVFGWAIGSKTGTIEYVKLYDKASAPNPSSDTPKVVIEVPGNTSGAGTNFCFAPGIVFATGIALAAVANPSDTDNTAIGANDLVINIFYT